MHRSQFDRLRDPDTVTKYVLTNAKQHWDGPIVLKGIQNVDDARKAIEVGAQVIVVSNHGGRQCDGGVGSLDTLPEIADAAADRLEIIFGPGVRGRMDIAKALALGAKMVFIGRLVIWGISLAGEGVRHILKSLLGKLNLSPYIASIDCVML